MSVHVRGLILPEPPFDGVNVVPNFRALVVYRSTDESGNAVRVQTFSAGFPASEEGDSDIVTPSRAAHAVRGAHGLRDAPRSSALVRDAGLQLTIGGAADQMQSNEGLVTRPPSIVSNRGGQT